MKTFEELEYQTVVLSQKEIDKTEFDNENDLKDLVSAKLKIDSYEEILSGWTTDGKHYVLVVKS